MQNERITRGHLKDPQKPNRNMQRKTPPHSVSSETQSPLPTREAIDYRETGAVGRRSFLRNMGIACASLAPVLGLLVASSVMADDTFSEVQGRHRRGPGL